MVDGMVDIEDGDVAEEKEEEEETGDGVDKGK